MNDNNNLYSIDLVAEYYDKCQKYYSWFWSDKESLALHYGFWERNTKSHKDALINQYCEVEKILQPKEGELILDAGCGIGGALFWLAKRSGAKFIGITISCEQLKIAEKIKSRNSNIADRIKFYKMNYLNTNFQDKTLDKIFAIESFCYSYPKLGNFLKEAYRILKTGGKIIISDAFLIRYPDNVEELKLMDGFYLGWKLNGGATKDKILASFKSIGFKEVKFIDKTEQIKRNMIKIFLRGVIALPFLKILRILRLISQVELENAYACINQKKIIENGILGYGIFYAEK